MKLGDFQEMLDSELGDALEPYLKTQKKSKGSDGGDEDDYTPSITKYLKGAMTSNWDKAKKEAELYEDANKYSSDVAGEGGILVHPQIQQQIVPLIRKKAVIRGLSGQVVNLPNTNTLQMPRQTQGSEAVWIGEDENVEDQVSQEVKWGDLELSLKTVAGFARLPNNLIEDATQAADQIVKNDLAQVIALKEDKAFLEGTGGNQPVGLYEDSDVESDTLGETLDANGNGFDDLIDAQTAVLNNGGNFNTWVMNPTLQGYIRGITDNNGNNIWQPANQQEGTPEMLLGKRVVYTRQIGVDGSSNTYAILADFSEFLIIQKQDGISLSSSTEADDAFLKNQTVFRAIRRVNGGPRVPENFYVLKDISVA